MIDTIAMDAEFGGDTSAPHDASRWNGPPRISLPSQVEALARLEYVADRQHGFALLTGPAGSGKTELLRQFATEQRLASIATILVDGVGCGETDLLRECCDDLALGCPANLSAAALRTALLEAVRGRLTVGTPVVVMIDHADRADAEAMRLIERLLHVRGDLAGLTLVAACREPVPPALADVSRDHADVRIQLAPLTADETGTVVQTMLLADGSPSEFTQEAVLGIHSRSDGDIRRIDRLCRLALAAADQDAAAAIDERMIEWVSSELQD